jgi:hypothetical protein
MGKLVVENKLGQLVAQLVLELVVAIIVVPVKLLFETQQLK